MLWDLFLLFIGLGLAAVGIVNPGTSPIWFGLAGLCLAAICIREWRARKKSALTEVKPLVEDVKAAAPGAHRLNDFIDARNDGRKLRGQLVMRPWDEAFRQDAQAFTNRCRALGRKWPEHREAIDRAIDKPLPTPLQLGTTPATNEEMVEALRSTTMARLQTILDALDRIIKPPTPISDAEFVHGCTTYIAIGEQKTVRIRQQPLETTDAEWDKLDEDVHAYLSEVLGFLYQRPKYWQRLSDSLKEPTHEELIPIQTADTDGKVTGTYIWGHGDALRERIGRVVQTLRAVVDES